MDKFNITLKGTYLIALLFLFLGHTVFAQENNLCDDDVPFYLVDFTGMPDATWTSPEHERKGKCCNIISRDLCTSFKVKLDSATAAIKIDIISGAIPKGSLYFQTSCGTQYRIGEEICFSGVGPHFISFCKPGNNSNIYRITTISSPLFPTAQTVINGCSKKANAYGLDKETVTWNSIYPGNPGDFNHYFSCTSNCTDPLVTPGQDAPEFVDYLVCGFPAAEGCGFTGQYCDTVRFFFKPEIVPNVLPSANAFLCEDASGVQLTGEATGGSGDYIFTWKDESGNILSNGPGFFATQEGDYILEVKDPLPGDPCIKTQNVKVSKVPLLVANAGEDLLVCAQAPVFNLNGSISNNGTGSWVGGNGAFYPSSQSMNATYTPTADEINSGFIKLTLTPDNNTLGCDGISDTISITFSKEPEIQVQYEEIKCNGDETKLVAMASGGMGSYTYLWNTSETDNEIIARAGNYKVNVTDGAGCVGSAEINLAEPKVLTAKANITPARCMKSNGEITIETTGGTQPYSYEWSNGHKSAGLKDLTEGTYSIMVFDNNGCGFELKADIQEIPPMKIYSDVQGVSCQGYEDGQINIKVSDGSAPYNFEWSNGGKVQSASGLKSGIYLLTVMDSHGCKTQKEYVLEQPESLSNNFEYSVYHNAYNISAQGGNDGFVKSIVSGGTEPYTWKWSNAQNNNELHNISAGEYRVTITDANGCTITDVLAMKEPTNIEIPNGFSPNGDGANDNFVIKGTEGFPDNHLMVFNRWGNEVFSQKNYTNTWAGENNRGERLPDGTYFIIFKININGVEETFKVYVEIKR